MAWRWDPTKVKFPTGPNCDGCPFRATSIGFAPPQGYDVEYDDETNTWLKYVPGYLWLHAAFAFIAEALGKDEARQGANLVGGTGGIYNRLLYKFAGLQRPRVAITNAVKCRPVRWKPCPECYPAGGECPNCDSKGQVPLIQKHGDYVNATPSPEQVRSCRERYLDEELAAFKGSTLVGLGRVPLRLFAGRALNIGDHRGDIFEPGILVDCERCTGTGRVTAGERKCPDCKGKGFPKCKECGRYGKHTKKCVSQSDERCDRCGGSKQVPRPPKRCPDCKGDKRVPEDPGNPYVSELVRPGQIFYATYHPAFVMRQPAQEIILETDFARIPNLREELEMADTSEYIEYPTEEQVKEVLTHKEISVDIETTSGLNPDNPLNEVMCIGATAAIGKAVVVGGNHRQTLEWLERAAVDDSIVVVGQNWMQFDAWFLYRQKGINPPLKCWDTRLAAHLDNPDTPNKLSYIVAQYAVPRMPGFWKTEQNYQDRKPYVCMLDVDSTLRAQHGQLDTLAKRFQVKEYWNEVFPAMQCAFDMRRDGMRVDLDALGAARKTLQAELDTGRRQLPDWGGVGTENQHEQVHKYLFETLRLPIQINADGNPSAGREQLDELLGLINEEHKTVEHLTTEEVHESIRFIELLQFLKGRSKLLTFYDPDKVPAGGSFHPQWNPAGTATFRYTANDPNAQQIPKCKCDPECHGRNPECKNARFPFIPDHSDWEIMGVDLAQAEVVGFLWYAQQWKVLDAVLNHGLDAHQVMADALGVPRKYAKTTSFGVIYGEDARTTAARTHKPLIEIQEMRDAYFKMFPGVHDFRTHFIRQAMNHGYVESCFGRRRYIKVRRPVGRAANQAANAPVQNIPPMVVRRAMSRLRTGLPERARLWANVHDEILLCYPKELRDITKEAVLDILGAPVPEMPAPELGMAGGIKFNLDIEVGNSWGTLQPID